MRDAIRPTQLHFRRLVNHFLNLTSGDRLLRFGSAVTDIDIVAYVEHLFVSATHVFAVVEPDQDISGVAALEFTGREAKLGLSVSSWTSGVGVGKALLQQATQLARTWGLKSLFVPNLKVNGALQQLAVGLGMNVVCASGALAEPPIVSGQEVRAQEGFTRSVTLVDDSLRISTAREVLCK